MEKSFTFDANDSFEITVQYMGDRVADLPFHAGELYDVEDRGTFCWVYGGATGDELVEVIRQLIENDDVGDEILLVNTDTGEEYSGWGEIRELLGRRRRGRRVLREGVM